MANPILTHEQILLRDGERLYLLVKLVAEGERSAARPPLNLSVALDRSSSMRGRPLRGALTAARALAERLDERDWLSVVVYDRDVHTLWGPAPVTDAGRAQLLDRLEHVMSGYLTNLGGAYVEACRHIAAHHAPQAVARAIVLTDGYPSYGVCDAQELAEMATFQRARGITTTAVGFGNAFDEDLLTQMSKAGGGNFYYVSAPDDIPKAFSQELGHVFGLGAQELRVQFQMAPIVESLGVLHDYPAQKNGDQVEIQIGDLYQGSPRLLLLELHARALSSGEELAVGELTFRYQLRGAEAQQKVVLRAPRQAASGPLDLNPTIGRELLRLHAAKSQADALQLADNNSFAEGKGLLDAAARRLRRYTDAYPEDTELREHLGDLESLSRRLATGHIDPNARKQIVHKTHHTRLSTQNLVPLQGKKREEDEEQ